MTEVLSKVPCPRQIFHMDLTTIEPELTALTRTHASSGLPKAPELQSQAGSQRAFLPGGLSSNMLMGQAQLHPVPEHGQASRPYAMAAEEGVTEPTAAEDCDGLYDSHAERQGAVVPRQGGMGASISQGITPTGGPASWSCAVPQSIPACWFCMAQGTVQPAQICGSRVKVLITAQKSPMYITLGVSSELCLFLWLPSSRPQT